MKKGLLFLMLSMLTIGAWADTYTPVEYIATTTSMKDGDSNANVPYINTGYVHKANTKIEMECAITAEQENWEALFGTRNGDGNTTNGAFVFFWRTNGSNVGCYNRGDGEKAGSNSIPKDERIKVLANPGSVTIKKVSDNSDVTTISTPEANASVGASHKPIYIFDTNTTGSEGLHPDGSRSYMKLYNFRIYEGDDLVHYYVPVKRDNDNKPGLYDLKTGSFVTSETSKNFDASTTVQTFTTWSTGDAILPSIKYGGSYSAYTWTKDLGHGWADEDYNIIAGTPAEISGKKWYETDYAPSSEWQFGNSVLPNSWSSDMGDIYVRRQFIIANNASLPSTVYMPAPHDDAPCEYYINGTLVWSRTGDELAIGADATEKYGIANGWYEGEVIRLTNEQKALIKTDGTVNVFAFHVHQNWGGRYADGGLYGDAGTAGSPSKQFTDNYPAIDALIALCETENTTNDASFQTAIDNAKAHQNMLQNTTNRFNDLVVARKRHNAEKVVEEFIGTAPADGLECYLYNVGEKKFLCGGNDWGTHASLGFAAHFVTLHQVDGGYKIQTHLPNGTEGTNVFLGENGYVDTTGDTWMFATIDGNYNIKLASDNTRLLGYESPTVNQVSTNCKTTTGATNQWKLVTKAERDALLTDATPDNPIDATYYIDNPGFDQRWSISNWTLSEDMAVNNRGQQKSDFVVSGWNEKDNGNTKENYRIEQVITGLMPGLYEVGVQACYRHGGDSEDDGESYAKLFANNEETIIKGVKAEINKIPQYTTLGTDEKAIEAFQTGLYKNKVRVAVGSDGELTIGVKRDAADFTPYDWLAADNFRLTYLGPTSESVTITSAGYATYCSENALDFTGKDIKAYVGTKTGDKLTFTPITQVPANTGLLLVYEGGKTEDVPVIASASAIAENCLVGVNVETTINSNDYILNKINDGVGFYKAGSFTTLGAHKAYIPAAVGNGVKGFTIDFDDDATGIKTLSDSPLKGENIYNLAGQRISKMQKGVNIVNGKKILK